jgi:hypothetical protein
MSRRLATAVLSGSFAFCSLLTGCSDGIKKEPNQLPTFKVTGSVTIDDEIPDPPVQLVCHPKDQSDSIKLPSCLSKEDGTFEMITYRDGDGAPAGEYVITATWKEYDLMRREYKELDKLKGRYSDPKTSQIELTVDNAPVDMGMIELKTK